MINQNPRVSVWLTFSDASPGLRDCIFNHSSKWDEIEFQVRGRGLRRFVREWSCARMRQKWPGFSERLACEMYWLLRSRGGDFHSVWLDGAPDRVGGGYEIGAANSLPCL